MFFIELTTVFIKEMQGKPDSSVYNLFFIGQMELANNHPRV